MNAKEIQQIISEGIRNEMAAIKRKTSSRKGRDRSVKCSDLKPEVLAKIEAKVAAGKCLNCGKAMTVDKRPDRAKRCDCGDCTVQFYTQRSKSDDKFAFEMRACNAAVIAPKDFKHRRKNSFAKFNEVSP